MSISSPTGVFFSLPSLGLLTAQSDFMTLWLQAMQATYPGYQPSAADPLYVQAQIFASWAANDAQLASSGADELFRQFGLKLLGVPYENGTSALAVVTVTAVNTAGHTLPAGTQLALTLNGVPVGFQTLTSLTIPAASSAGNVTVASILTGSGFNGAGSPAELDGVSWIASVTVVTTASGGQDQEDDSSYLIRLANTLTTLKPSVVTASDAATWALNFQPAAGTDQEEVGRATAIDGYSPGPQTFVVTTANTSPTITVTTPPATGVIAAPYASVTGAGIPGGAYVLPSPAPSTSSFTISANATATATGVSATVSGSNVNERTLAVCISDASGLALNSDTLTAVSAGLGATREVGFIFNVFSPNYTLVYVSVTVGKTSGATSATVQANVQAAILGYLNPANFGLPIGAATGWAYTQTIFISRVETAIQLASGVDHIVSGTLKVDVIASPSNTADLLINGPFPLPTTTTVSVPPSAITVV